MDPGDHVEVHKLLPAWVRISEEMEGRAVLFLMLDYKRRTTGHQLLLYKGSLDTKVLLYRFLSLIFKSSDHNCCLMQILIGPILSDFRSTWSSFKRDSFSGQFSFCFGHLSLSLSYVKANQHLWRVNCLTHTNKHAYLTLLSASAPSLSLSNTHTLFMKLIAFSHISLLTTECHLILLSPPPPSLHRPGLHPPPPPPNRTLTWSVQREPLSRSTVGRRSRRGSTGVFAPPPPAPGTAAKRHR